MTTALWIILIAILCYMAIMLAIGFAVSGKSKTADGFFLGGRSLGPLVTAMSAEASDMSGWLLMGLPAVTLMGGITEASWTAVGLAIGTYLNWLFVAKRLRVYSGRLGAFTLPDFFSRRFADSSHILTTVAALFIVVFFIPYTASGFAACGKLFAALFDMDYLTAMLLCAAVILLYCTVGGFLAASTTDLFQSVIMTVALFVIVGFSEGLAHGFDTVFASVRSFDGYLDLFRGYDIAGGATSSYGALPVASTLAWGLGYFGMPHILLRFMGIKDENKLKISRRVATVWVILSMGVAILIGVVGTVLRQNGILPLYETASAAETVIVDLAKLLSTHGFVPAAVGGIVLAGILASTMSTADSQLLAASSSVSQNLLQEVLHLKLSPRASVWLSRLSVIVISIVAIFLARDPQSSVFRIVEFSWAGFGAVFGPVVLCSLFWKRTTKWGALAGMIIGGGTVFFWKFVIRRIFMGTVLDFYELLPAFLLALLSIVAVSLLTKAPDDSVTSVFEEVRAA